MTYAREMALKALVRSGNDHPHPQSIAGAEFAIKEVIERCAFEVERRVEWNKRGRGKVAARIRALATPAVPEGKR